MEEEPPKVYDFSLIGASAEEGSSEMRAEDIIQIDYREPAAPVQMMRVAPAQQLVRRKVAVEAEEVEPVPERTPIGTDADRAGGVDIEATLFKSIEFFIPRRLNPFLTDSCETRFQKVVRVHWKKRAEWKKQVVRFCILLGLLLCGATWVSGVYDPVGLYRQSTFVEETVQLEPRPTEATAIEVRIERVIPAPTGLLDHTDPIHEDWANMLLLKLVFPPITPETVRRGYVEGLRAGWPSQGNISLVGIIDTLKGVWMQHHKDCVCAAHVGVSSNIVMMWGNHPDTVMAGELDGSIMPPDHTFTILIEPRVLATAPDDQFHGEFIDSLEPEGFALDYSHWIKVEYLTSPRGKTAKDTFYYDNAACVTRCLTVAGRMG